MIKRIVAFLLATLLLPFCVLHELLQFVNSQLVRLIGASVDGLSNWVEK